MSRGADRGESDKSACRSQAYDLRGRDHGDISFSFGISMLILCHHENGRPCRVSCSKLPYVLYPYAAGVGAFSAFLELERDGNCAL